MGYAVVCRYGIYAYMGEQPPRRPRTWLVLSVPCLALAVLAIVREAWWFAAILIILGVGLVLRAIEEWNPPDG